MEVKINLIVLYCCNFQNRIKQIMTYCFTAVKHKLNCKMGYFDLYGFDFMIDEDMKVSCHNKSINQSINQSMFFIPSIDNNVTT